MAIVAGLESLESRWTSSDLTNLRAIEHAFHDLIAEQDDDLRPATFRICIFPRE